MSAPYPTKRWTPMDLHPVQAAMMATTARFNVVAAGRRSGKTELIGKRWALVKLGEYEQAGRAARVAVTAPTRQQAKDIFWTDLIALIPAHRLVKRSDSELSFTFKHGSELHVIGLDKPQRIEGQPWDGVVVTEAADVKTGAWQSNIRPALSDRQGWAWIEGVPEGRNWFYDIFRAAEADTTGEWSAWHWTAADAMPLYLGREAAEKELASAAASMDAKVFDQEYNASFVSFVGQAYYAFDVAKNCRAAEYNPDAELILAFDFNVDPGVAAVLQERQYGTQVIGEVHIPNNSNTQAVCRRLAQDWGSHRGPVILDGDATGGARGTAKLSGSDWDIVKTELGAVFANLSFKVQRGNPSERARINAMNTRLCTSDGERRLFVDPAKAPHVVRDLEGVGLLEGGSGEIDKKKDRALTHISDAVGYYIAREFPVRRITVAPVGGAVVMAGPAYH